MRSITYKWNYNKKAMKYCNFNNLYIYPACQSNGKLFLFVQQGERFKRLNDKIYSQHEEEFILEYTIDIIKAYEEYAKKIKLKKDEHRKNNKI